jgi:excisionase family DNA binding protein
MSLAELIKNADGTGANISVTISLNELKQFHEELVQNAIAQNNQIEQEKKKVEYLTPEEVCKLLKTSRTTLTRWQKANYLAPVKTGGRCYYIRNEIEKLMSSKRS